MVTREEFSFLSPDDGLIQGPEINFAVGDEMELEISDEVDEVDDDQNQEGDDDVLLKRMEELQAQNADLSSRMEQMKDLKVQLPEGYRQQQQPQRPQPPQDDNFYQDLNENFFKDPAKYLQEFQKRKLSPELTGLVANSVMMGKRFLEVDPDKRDNYKKYKGEIDSTISKLNPAQVVQNPNIFNDVYDSIMARHLDDVVESRMEAKLEEALNAKLTALGISLGEDGEVVQESQNQPRQPGFKSEKSSSYSRGGGGSKKVRLTVAEAAQADKIGMNYKDYYNYLKGKGKK